MKKILIFNLLIFFACSTQAQDNKVPKFLKDIQGRFEKVYELETECDSMFIVQSTLKGRISNKGIPVEILENYKMKVGIINDTLPSTIIVSLHKEFKENLIFSEELIPLPEKKEISKEFSVNKSGEYRIKLQLKEPYENDNPTIVFYVCYKYLN